MSAGSPSIQQASIIDAPLSPMSVIACAGSGKTFTAVRRLAQMRRILGEHRGRVALLSFSNIAVDTFRREYAAIANGPLRIPGHQRVEIDTLDGFITTNVLRPHAYRTMGCNTTPFILSGNEAFLSSAKYQFWAESKDGRKYPVSGSDLHNVGVYFAGDKLQFRLRSSGGLTHISAGVEAFLNLGKIGACTHELARLWSYYTLDEQRDVLRVLANRYPHILIDEAQDIGFLHQKIIEQMIEAGSQVSLIGDPNQGIYEFMGATGSFLSEYHLASGVKAAALTRNYRSVPAVLDLANALSLRADDPDRSAPNSLHGAYFVPYKTANRRGVLTAFQAKLVSAGLDPARSAVLCRARKSVNELAGNDGAPGAGTVKIFAQAAILRDLHSDFVGAFKEVVRAVIGLTENADRRLAAQLTQPTKYPEQRTLRRLLWAFNRNPSDGLPGASLRADSEWQPELVKRVRLLMERLRTEHGLTHEARSLGARLSKRGLTNDVLIGPPDLADDEPLRVRIDTVHQVKGESLDAVLYLATKAHVTALLDGVSTEDGRIGYVAITRAKDLFWLGVPDSALKVLRAKLLERGFKDATSSVR